MFDEFMNVEGSLFGEFRRMEQTIDELLSQWPGPTGIRSVPRGAYPPLNMGSTPDGVDIYLFAPGLDPAAIDVSVQQNLLTVSGERQTPGKEGASFYRKERFNGAFRRAIALPDDVDPDKVDARYRDGVLHIHLQRSEAARPRQITVN